MQIKAIFNFISILYEVLFNFSGFYYFFQAYLISNKSVVLLYERQPSSAKYHNNRVNCMNHGSD